MLRRILITALATSAISFAILGFFGCAFPIYREYRITGRLHFYVYFSGGLARLYWIGASDDIDLDPIDGAVRMAVRRVSDGALCHRYYHAAPGQITPFAWLQNRWNPRGPASTTAMYFFGARTWTWLPVTLLITYPVVSLVSERIHHYLRRYRKRHGLCHQCGYNLTGLPEPRCPECGASCHDRPEAEA